ncbi:MAG TPA: hypothetical protein VNM48_18095 [Chloroflexota bacterium]|nr:hypothetical protein [Chloroflexota bacterium]
MASTAAPASRSVPANPHGTSSITTPQSQRMLPRRKGPEPEPVDASEDAPLARGRKRQPLDYPSQAYVQARADERTERLGGASAGDPTAWDIPTTFDGMILAVRARRKMQVATVVPAAYRGTSKDTRVGSALIDDAISVVAGTLVGGERRVQVIPADESEDEQQRTADLKKWLWAAVIGDQGQPSVLQQACGEPFFELGIDQACGDGKAIWELTTREELWSEEHGYPSADDYDDDDDTVPHAERKTRDQKYLKATDRFKKYAPFPFEMARVDPLSFDEWKVRGTALEAIKIENRSVREIYPRYGLHRRENGEVYLGEPYPEQDMPAIAGSKTAKCITFWKADPLPNDKGECRVLWTYDVDGKRVAKGETIGPAWHPLPYFPFSGLHSSLPDPAFKSVSIAFRLLRLADSLDTLLSMKFNIAALFSMPICLKYNTSGGVQDVQFGAESGKVGAPPSAGSTGAGATFSLEVGKGYELASGWDIRPLVPPPDAVAVLDSLKNDIMDMINIVGLPAALRGVSPGSGSAGYMVAQLIAAARTKLAPVLNNAADALSQLCGYLLWKVEHQFPEGVPLWAGGDAQGEWLSIGAKDIDGRYAVRVGVEPNLPVDRIQQAEASLTQQQSGAISMKRHREEGLSIDDPLAEEELIEAEKVRQHPLVAIPRAIRAAVRLGYLTPEEGDMVRMKELGIEMPAPPPAMPQLLGPNGEPMAPTGSTPGVPQVPGGPPIMPPVPDDAGYANTAQVMGAAGTNSGPQIPSQDLAAMAVGS